MQWHITSCRTLQIIPSREPKLFYGQKMHTSPRIASHKQPSRAAGPAHASGPTKQQIANRLLIHRTQASASSVPEGKTDKLRFVHVKKGHLEVW